MLSTQNTITYDPSYIGKEVFKLADELRPLLWEAVSSSPPYRRYYLYHCPTAEATLVLPQLASIYATMYFLSSITRYRPHHFHRLLDGAYGPFIESFLNDQPQQFLFLMASSFNERDVTKAALV